MTNDLLPQSADLGLDDASASVDERDAQGRPFSNEYDRLVEGGNLLIIRTDAAFTVTSIHGNTAAILGVDPSEVLHRGDTWKRFLPEQDRLRLWARVREVVRRPRELSEEVRIVNQQTGDIRWMLLRAVPIKTSRGRCEGWEGIGIDITAQKSAQEEVIRQSRRLSALYEVSNALHLNLDPAVVLLRGVRALLRATNSEAGIGCNFDEVPERFDLMAAEGLSDDALADVVTHLQANGLLKAALSARRGFIVADLKSAEYEGTESLIDAGFRGALVIPLAFEDHVLGVVVFFTRGTSRYQPEDLEFVDAASHQLALATRQAQLYQSERKNAASQAALYRLTHELSKYFTPREVAEHAFPLLAHEIPYKRIWLAILNEQGTHLVGQAGRGPGMRRRIAQLQIPLRDGDLFAENLLRTGRITPLRANESLPSEGLSRLRTLLGLGGLLVVPLESLRQVVGVLVIEPHEHVESLSRARLGLLRSMANEIAMVILARRFEARMALADKLRMVGSLAGGVAHNFNNLLQAIIGQASLLEMQLGTASPLVRSTRMILDAAQRGAGLIGHLLTFSSQEARAHKSFATSDLLDASHEFYRSVLGGSVTLQLDTAEGLPNIRGDVGQLQQAVVNLLVNAHEAILRGARERGVVKLTGRLVRVMGSEQDLQLVPGHYIRVDVEDNGCGMDEASYARCFEPFFTTKLANTQGPEVGGYGLGLSTAFAIIRQHGGTITVKSEPGRGSTFSLYLPQADQPEHRAPEPREEEGAPDVLAIALDVGVAESVKSFFSSSGLRMAICAPSPALWHLADHELREAQIVLVDLDRIGVESDRVLERVRGLAPRALLAGIVEERQRWMHLGVRWDNCVIIEKPLSVWVLHTLVNRVKTAAKA